TNEPLPTRVSSPSPVARCTVANSRTTTPSSSTAVDGSPRKRVSIGAPPTMAYGPTRQFAPTRAPACRTEPTSKCVPAPTSTSSSTTTPCSTTTPAARRARGWTSAPVATRTPLGAPGSGADRAASEAVVSVFMDGSAGVDERQVGLGGNFVADQSAGFDLAQAAAERHDRSGQAQLVTGDDLASEPRLLDGGEVPDGTFDGIALLGAVTGGVALAHGQADGRGLRQRLHHEDARHDRLAREVAREERLVVAHVLDALEI